MTDSNQTGYSTRELYQKIIIAIGSGKSVKTKNFRRLMAKKKNKFVIKAFRVSEAQNELIKAADLSVSKICRKHLISKARAELGSAQTKRILASR